MDKRKLDVEKTGNATITRNRFGSGYKNKSIFLNEQKQMEVASSEARQASKEISDSYNPDLWLNQFESKIFEFCNNKKIPTEWIQSPGDKVTLSVKLQNEYQQILGARQAGICLFEIHCCRDSRRQGKHENATAQALRLAQSYSHFLISMLEPTLNKGAHTSKNFKKPLKLSEQELSNCFQYFEKTQKNPVTKIKYTDKERWKKTSSYCLSAFGITIAPATLRKKYAKKVKK
ncbi:hypothetical protein FE810_01770 [Thalassotalea litorea]|uniref:Uncharacterized protein n=1 Tax=Thalassotalea litorea TaxID=2020715 RepID=A0A5R9IWD8_9GAMM|nr:hypothetical protein [Thalassotalea litorea]TLU67701.1 hypothetical protein FE810_01770 [Thalassotalea litorea]